MAIENVGYGMSMDGYRTHAYVLSSSLTDGNSKNEIDKEYEEGKYKRGISEMGRK